MDLSEFKSVTQFSKNCKDDKNEESIKPAHFGSVMTTALQGYGVLLVRDFLDVDRTFSVISQYNFELIEAVRLLQDVKDHLEMTTYDKVKNVGLISLNEYTGFWVLI